MEMLPLADPAGIEQVAADVAVALEDVEEKVGVLAAVAGQEGVVEELVLQLARLGRIAGGRLLRLPQDHEGGRLLVGQLGDGGDEAAAGDDKDVVDLRGVDLVAGVHEIAPLDDRPAVARQIHVVEIEGPVRLDVDVFQEGLPLQAGVVGLGLLAGVEAVGLDEQPPRLETAEGAVRDTACRRRPG